MNPDTFAPHETVERKDIAARVAGRIDAVLGPLIAVPAAVLVALEIVILFSGAMARYVFHKPIIWSDEMAALLFLWLAMLGAAYAFRNGEHMRMGAVVGWSSGKVRLFLDALAIWAALAFLAFAMRPALNYAHNEIFITTPGLGISGAWRAYALPVGFGLMILSGILQLLRLPDRRQVLLAALPAIALGLLFFVLKPFLVTLGTINLLIFFVGLIAICIFAGVPIAFAFGLGTLCYLIFTTRIPTSIVVVRMDEGMNQIILLAVPMFIFLGQLMEMTTMAKAMVSFLASLVGHVRGGLNYVLIGAMYLVSGISGAKSADMAAVAPALFPEMIRRGAKEGDLVALLAATGAQTETIPPSIVLLAIAAATGVSISALFTGGLLPGLVLGVMLCLVVRHRYKGIDLTTLTRASGRHIFQTFLLALPALALPFLIRAAVVEGIATATEVSTIGIIYAIVVGLFVYRSFDWRRFCSMLVYTAGLSGAILMIIGAATGVSWGLSQSGFSDSLAKAMIGLPGGATSFMALSIVLFVVLGSVLEGIPAIVLFAPLLFPIARSVGIHEVQYAMVVILAMGIGLFMPPFGVGYYTACAIARIDPTKGLRPIVGYMTAVGVGLVIVASIPWISVGFLEEKHAAHSVSSPQLSMSPLPGPTHIAAEESGLIPAAALAQSN